MNVGTIQKQIAAKATESTKTALGDNTVLYVLDNEALTEYVADVMKEFLLKEAVQHTYKIQQVGRIDVEFSKNTKLQFSKMSTEKTQSYFLEAITKDNSVAVFMSMTEFKKMLNKMDPDDKSALLLKFMMCNVLNTTEVSIINDEASNG